jgi:hypothetical protein
VVDSPNQITYAHADGMFKHDLSRKARSNIEKALITAANERGPAFVP